MPITRGVFFLNALFTLAGGVILLVAPNQIMQLAGASVEPRADFVYYLLGASALSLAVLSFFGMTWSDTQAVRAAAVTFVVFHASSAAVAVYVIAHGVSAAVWANVAVHILFALLFLYVGVRRTSNRAA
jgi:hypothetical protein